MNTSKLKPHRPLGLSIAVILGIVLFTVFPMIEVIWVAIFNNLSQLDPGNVILGVDVLGVDYTLFTAQGIVSVGFLIVAILAWLGRPKWVEIAFPAMVVISGLFLLFARIIPGLMTPLAEVGIDSTSGNQRNFVIVLVIVIVLYVIYTLWFTRRWSTRAYFRKTYSDADKTRLQGMGVEVS